MLIVLYVLFFFLFFFFFLLFFVFLFPLNMKETNIEVWNELIFTELHIHENDEIGKGEKTSVEQ
jgi:hypothetical protein